MAMGSTKRIVVIKDIQSNIIEEAIFILKSESTSKNTNNNKEVLHKGQKNGNDYLLKEAELIINNYIKENKKHRDFNKELTLKPSFHKNKITISTAINLALIGSIALLLFLVTRFI